jgi:hypothetical protein
MSILNNIRVSIITRKEETSLRSVSYPPVFKEQSNAEHIKDAVFRCMKFSSKFINYDELEGKYVTEDNNNLKYISLDGANQISNHHCAGIIQSSINNTEYIKQANMYFEIQENCIQKNSLQGKNIKIQRRDGTIINGKITNNSILRYNKHLDDIMIHSEFIICKDIFNKFIPFHRYEYDEVEIKGLLELNPQLLEEDLIITIYNSPKWMKDERDAWYKFIKLKLEKSKFNIIYNNID